MSKAFPIMMCINRNFESKPEDDGHWIVDRTCKVFQILPLPHV